MWSMFLLIILMLCVGFAAWIFFLWAVKSGQYDDIEGPKYRMLDDDEGGPSKDKTGRVSAKENSNDKTSTSVPKTPWK